MTRPTFSWNPDFESENDEKPNANVTVFGDGYESRVGDSINMTPQKWSVVFSRDRATVLAARAFLVALAGVGSFYWTTPFEELGVYVCREWKTKSYMGYLQLTATFEQVFET